MGSNTAGTGLESDLHSLVTSSRTSIRATVILANPGRNLCRSDIRHQLFTTDADVEAGDHFTLIGCLVTHQNGPHLQVDDDTRILRLKEHTTEGFKSVIEVCAGIGAAGKGFEFCGAQTTLYAEYNAEFAKWLRKRTSVPVIEGNIAEHQVIADMFEAFPFPHVLFGGVSCQPFSRLGDQRGFADKRSESFLGLLQSGYFMHSLCIIAECTQEALESTDVQQLLSSFARETGWQVKQKILTLHKTWTSFRTRWWAILAPSWVNLGEIQEMPELPFAPTVSHITPSLLSSQDEYMKQLHLDIEELRVFYNYKKPIETFVIDVWKTIPTATHSWGSQARGCCCGCRTEGFHPQRIAEKGLHALLIPTGERSTTKSEWYDGMRHPHPQELALMTGLSPDWIQPDPSSPARLDLAGVGQLASPLQAAWILAQVHQAVDRADLFPEARHPRVVVADICRDLLRTRKEIFTNKSTRLTVRMEYAVETLDKPRIEYAQEDDFEAIQALRVWCESNDAPPTKRTKIGPSKAPHLCKDVPPTLPDSISPDHSLKIIPSSKEIVYDATGGLNCFASKATKSVDHQAAATDSSANPKQEHHETEHPPKPAPSVPPVEEATAIKAVVTPTITWQAQPAIEPVEAAASKTPASEPDTWVWVGLERKDLYQVPFQGHPTVGQIAQSQASLQNLDPASVIPLTVMGQFIPLPTPVEHMQIILLRPCAIDVMRCPLNSPEPSLPDLSGLPRKTALWNQRGWVAFDEMTHYLEIMERNGIARTTPPCILSNNEAGAIELGQWINQATEKASCSAKETKVFSAALIDHHWAPLMLDVTDEKVAFSTSTCSFHHIKNLSAKAFSPEEVDLVMKHSLMHHDFPADCGFQVLAWIMDHSGMIKPPTKLDSAAAARWRAMFSQHVTNLQIDQQQVGSLILGGSPDAQSQQMLEELLLQRGVKRDRIKEALKQIVTQIGLPRVVQAMQSSRPWAEIKARANACSPPIQLVLPSELKEKIAEKIAAGDTFGRKQNKKQKTPPAKQHQPPLHIQSQQVAIPTGIFVQQDGTPLAQIQANSIKQSTRGVAIMNIEEALPFFQLNQHLSSEGIALLILEYSDERIPSRHEVVRFPATCVCTEEPMLITCAMLQIGHQQVARATPSACASIDEVDTTVIRITVWKDQYEQSWRDFTKSPVKHIMEHTEFANLSKDHVLDVWDRQHLTKQYHKSNAKDSELFSVIIRLQSEAASHLIDHVSITGCYLEPRSDNGRSADPRFRVLWLPKKSFGQVMVAKQASPHPTWIIRSGDRFGLRALSEHMPSLHEMHRPDVKFLQGAALTTYKVGPLPFGTTRAALQKACKTWQWDARPGQPSGQTADRSGIYWTMQATSDPSHWVYTMTHGDVLVTKETHEKQTETARKDMPVASAKTIKHLAANSANSAKPSRANAFDKHADLLQVQDPWAKPTPTKALSPLQVAAIEASVEKKVIDSIRSKTKDDLDMDIDDHDERFTTLESQVAVLQEGLKSMQTNVNQIQSNQQQMSTNFAAKVNAIQAQVDQGQAKVEKLLDEKLETHMDRIESLLLQRDKRFKSGEMKE